MCHEQYGTGAATPLLPRPAAPPLRQRPCPPSTHLLLLAQPDHLLHQHILVALQLLHLLLQAVVAHLDDLLPVLAVVQRVPTAAAATAPAGQ